VQIDVALNALAGGGPRGALDQQREAQMLGQLAIVMLVMKQLRLPSKGGDDWYSPARGSRSQRTVICLMRIVTNSDLGGDDDGSSCRGAYEPCFATLSSETNPGANLSAEPYSSSESKTIAGAGRRRAAAGRRTKRWWGWACTCRASWPCASRGSTPSGCACSRAARFSPRRRRPWPGVRR
jgi:hypothetical protein